MTRQSFTTSRGCGPALPSSSGARLARAAPWKAPKRFDEQVKSLDALEVGEHEDVE